MKITADVLAELQARALSKALEMGQVRILIEEASDGSRRYQALIGWDGQFTIFTPAPEGAPAWAGIYTDFMEVSRR